jgi:hypothetical protein
MEEFFSPEEVRLFINKCETDRQKIILFLIYNYGITVEEAIDIKASQFMVKSECILFNFKRKSTHKQHTYKIQGENYRMFYRAVNKLQAGEPLLHKDKNLPISEAMVDKDMFDLAVTMNRKITTAQLFNSHLFWLFRRGVTYSQAVEEYGLPLSGSSFKIWESAMMAKRLWPFLLE